MKNRFLIPLFAVLLSACATSQIKLHSDLVYSDASSEVLILNNSVRITATHAKPLILKPATRWYQVGTIDLGVVYNTHDQVISVNSFDVFEGYIVVNQGSVIGYYLPTENTFVKTKPVTINFQQQ